LCPCHKGDRKALDWRLLDFYWRCPCRSAQMNLQAYQVEFFETASQISNGLWDACFQPPAAGRWWYEILDQSGIEDQLTFCYALIKHLGCPVGIAPVFAMDVPVDQVARQVRSVLFRLLWNT